MTARVARIDADLLLETIVAFRDRMRDHEEEVNALNVFPIPDGDTGTNLLLTLDAVLAAADHPGCTKEGDGIPLTPHRPSSAREATKARPVDLSKLCEELSRGMILGARGSSGVILSQAVAAALDVIVSSTEQLGGTLVAALQQAATAAYQAVAQPVEGTMLTVLSAVAAAARSAADLPVSDLTELMALEARAAVARTPLLLPVLAQAGVVDSGGRGLSYGFDALAEVVGGRSLPPPPPVGQRPRPSLSDVSHATGAPDVAGTTDAALQAGGQYEVVASLDTTPEGAERLRAQWQRLGDTVVVSGTAHTWRGHVHTDDPDRALSAARQIMGAGVGDVNITDLHAQLIELASRESPSVTQTLESPGSLTGGLEVVAVVAGDGIARAYTELGARVVDGTVEPSLQELLTAIDAAETADVAVLPNETNVIPSVAQAAKLTRKRVHILPSQQALAGLAALVALDTDASVAANLATMKAILHRTRAGRVARVVRDSVVATGPVHPGQWIAIADRRVVAVGATSVEAALLLTDHLHTPTTELLTVAWGVGATEQETAALRAEMSADHPEDVIDVFNGGHRDAFWISAEDAPDADPDASGPTGKGVTDR